MAWVLGGRDSATFKRLYDKVMIGMHLPKYYLQNAILVERLIPLISNRIIVTRAII